MVSQSLVLASDFLPLTDRWVHWTVYDPSIRTALTSHGLRTDAGWLLFDPAPIEAAALRRLSGSLRVGGVVLSNENHERASTAIATALSCPIFMHESNELIFKGLEVQRFREGQNISGEVVAVEIPGATAHETCFFDAKGSLMIMGDALINLKETGFQLLPDKYCKDPSDAKRSLKRLFDFQFENMLFAHGDPIFGKARDQVEAIFKSFV